MGVTDANAEATENWQLVMTPLGEIWSGRARYAAAMFFYQNGEMDAETLEVYRLCSRLDGQDPVAVMRERHVGANWAAKLQNATHAIGQTSL